MSCAMFARSFCRRACCTGLGRSSVFLDERNSSTSSSATSLSCAPTLPSLRRAALSMEFRLFRLSLCSSEPSSPQLPMSLRSSLEPL